MDESRWAVLSTTVRDRRLELGLSARTASARAGINRATWASLEANTNRLSRHLWSAVETTLQWQPGSIEAVLAGGDPTPVTRPTTTPPQTNSARLAAEIERVKRLPLPIEDRLTMLRALIDLYAEAGGDESATPEHLAG